MTPRSLSLSVTVSVTLHSLSFPISGSVSNSSALVKAGVSCQLKFLEGEGDRDKVVIYDEAGKELAAHTDMQHNKNYGQLRQNNAA